MGEFFQMIADFFRRIDYAAFFETIRQSGSILQQFFERIGQLFSYLSAWLSGNGIPWQSIYFDVVRFLMPLLAIVILVTVLRDMVTVRNHNETWGYFVSPEFGRLPVEHWECTLGRASHCDIVVSSSAVSRTQLAVIRDQAGRFLLHNLSNFNKTTVNGQTVPEGGTQLEYGDEVGIGRLCMSFMPISQEEESEQAETRRLLTAPRAPWLALYVLTIFQLLTATELLLRIPEHRGKIAVCFAVLLLVMWSYVFLCKLQGNLGFEPEILAFFGCTLSLAVVASAMPEGLPKQTAAIVIGVAFLYGMRWYLDKLRLVVHTRYFMAAVTIGLLLITLIFGFTKFGAQNWIQIGGLTFQPSELAKVTYIFAGAATLDRLFVKHNVWGFMALSFACFGLLAIEGDFGGAAIFFVTFLVIAYIRSGDFATLTLVCGGVGVAGLMVLKFKPYIAERFAVWGHAWENASGAGFQQVRTMSAASSGGLIGTGAGNGWLHSVAAAETDLVFGMVCEEWGLIIGLLCIAGIIAMAVFTVRVTQSGRSSYYTIAACAASSTLVFQTILNVFGSVDLLPLTGVTFPFLSAGGSSIIACFGLLAFIKAADNRYTESVWSEDEVEYGAEYGEGYAEDAADADGEADRQASPPRYEAFTEEDLYEEEDPVYGRDDR